MAVAPKHRQPDGLETGSSYGAYLSTNLEQEIAALRRSGRTAVEQSAPVARKVSPMVIALASLSIVPIGAIVGLAVLVSRPAKTPEPVNKMPEVPRHLSQENRAAQYRPAPTLSRTPTPPTSVRPPDAPLQWQKRRQSNFGAGKAD